MRLLLVEDSQRLREGLQTGLAGAGFEVDAADDGAAALAASQLIQNDSRSVERRSDAAGNWHAV